MNHKWNSQGQKKFLEEFAIKFGILSLDDWGRIRKDDILKHGGRGIEINNVMF